MGLAAKDSYLNVQQFYSDGSTLQMQVHFHIAGAELSTRNDYRRFRSGKEIWWSDGHTYPLHPDDRK